MFPETWVCAHEDDKQPGHTTLYVIHSMTSEDVLYVGITGDVRRRFKQHRKVKPWWRDSENASLECYDSWESACEAERSRIDTYRPVHNVIGNAHRREPSRPCEICGYPIPIVDLDHDEEPQTQHDQCNSAICDAYMAGAASMVAENDPFRVEVRSMLKRWV